MAREMLYANALRQDPTPTPEMLGTGTAAQAGKAIQDRGYKLHVAEAQAMGETPKTYEAWKAGQ